MNNGNVIEDYFNDVIDRRNAELEFVSCAYTNEEAWYNVENVEAEHEDAVSYGNVTVHRRLRLFVNHDNNNNNTINVSSTLCYVLILKLPDKYPLNGCINVSGRLDEQVDDDDEINRLRQQSTNNWLWNIATTSLSSLIKACQDTSNSLEGSESIFSIFTTADDWMNETWQRIVDHEQNKRREEEHQKKQQRYNSNRSVEEANYDDSHVVITICRMLLYSHHIIGKEKRSDMISLSSEYKLTGFCKIGWPGIIIIEGMKESCYDFYDIIRRWTWQYLVRRCEDTDELVLTIPAGTVSASRQCMIIQCIDAKRLFPKFHEVDDMSIVASHCRSVGLESFFLTSMKVYNKETETGNNNNNKNSVDATASTDSNDGKIDQRKKKSNRYKANSGKNVSSGIVKSDDDDDDNQHHYSGTHHHNVEKSTSVIVTTTPTSKELYGCLVHVDHMNDVKYYSKWLHNVSMEYNVTLLIRHCYPTIEEYDDNNNSKISGSSTGTSRKRPKIFVILIGSGIDPIRTILKRWRSTKVDVDSKGKPCYERMMSVLIEGIISTNPSQINLLCNNSNKLLVDNGKRLSAKTVASQNSCNLSSTSTTYDTIVLLSESIGGQLWKDCTMSVLY